MPKEMTRRAFVTTCSVLAAASMTGVRAAASGATVDISRYNRRDWIAAFKKAFTDGDTVVVPAGLTCDNINTAIFIPEANPAHPRRADRQRTGTAGIAGWQ